MPMLQRIVSIYRPSGYEPDALPLRHIAFKYTSSTGIRTRTKGLEVPRAVRYTIEPFSPLRGSNPRHFD